MLLKPACLFILCILGFTASLLNIQRKVQAEYNFDAFISGLFAVAFFVGTIHYLIRLYKAGLFRKSR